MRIGIYGGTFNPPHVGHLICAQEALIQLALDRVVFIPAAVPPHKTVPDDPGAQHRLGMCRAAVSDDERFEVSDLEVVRAGTSYTLDTLEELNTSVPDSDLFLILGADVAAGLPRWHRPETDPGAGHAGAGRAGGHPGYRLSPRRCRAFRAASARCISTCRRSTSPRP